MNGDFHTDDKWQREQRDRFLLPFYEQWSDNHKYVLIDKGRCATIVQKRLAVDTVASHRGSTWFIEEKICRHPFPNFFLETDSCTVPGYESNGWMHYGEADLLFYCFADNEERPTFLDSYLLDFQKLKKWFWSTVSQWRERTVQHTSNHSRGRIIPRTAVVSSLSPFHFRILEAGVWSLLDDRQFAPHDWPLCAETRSTLC